MKIDSQELIKKYGNAVKLYDTTFAKMFLSGNTLIKKYKLETDVYSRLDLDVFNVLSKLKSTSFIKLNECFTENVVLPTGEEIEILNGYTSEFLRKKITKMIDMPIDYTLETLYEFKRIVEFLNENSVVIVDECAANCIVSKNGLVIVDPDFFKHDDNAYNYNLSHINTYIESTWSKEYGIYNLRDKNKLHSLFYDKNVDNYYDVMKERMDEDTPRKVIEKTLKKSNDSNKSTCYF